MIGVATALSVAVTAVEIISISESQPQGRRLLTETTTLLVQTNVVLPTKKLPPDDICNDISISLNSTGISVRLVSGCTIHDKITTGVTVSPGTNNTTNMGIVAGVIVFVLVMLACCIFIIMAIRQNRHNVHTAYQGSNIHIQTPHQQRSIRMQTPSMKLESPIIVRVFSTIDVPYPYDILYQQPNIEY
jgi:hypothetical protein